ncbi:MAG: GAF and ANTAR domain-containing protein [Actinomycetota bacterium]|nr:GAF and ANTAR domain-containing protein [Actinomycetota bacterium]MDQ3680902.1 GAF and ANTAR domain-containing protein [Actinomycetota bacterium]
MPGMDDFDRQVAKLHQVLLSDQDIDRFLKRVTELSVSLVPACDTCSVSVLTGERKERFRTRVSSDPVAERVDEHQYGGEEGPCLEAISTGRVVRSGLMAEEVRWAGFPAAASSEGVVSSFSLPLRVQDRTIGALNLYSLSTMFDEEDQKLAGAFATQAAVAVANADAYHQAQELGRHLEEALKSRDVIGQAKGIIMERERVTADAAFDVLRSVSQARNMKLREVAELVVLTGTWKVADDKTASR